MVIAPSLPNLQEEYLDRHQPHARPPAGKRPFLLLLSPDTLTLATSSDATDGPPVASAVASMLTLKADRPPVARPSKKPLALLHKLSTVGGERSGAEGRDSEGNGGSTHCSVGNGKAAGSAPHPDPAAADSRLLLEDGEQLEEGQLLNFSIALSQVVGVELVDERRVKVGGCCVDLFCDFYSRPAALNSMRPRKMAVLQLTGRSFGPVQRLPCWNVRAPGLLQACLRLRCPTPGRFCLRGRSRTAAQRATTTGRRS